MDLSMGDQIRIRWAAARYAFWLDLYHVPGRARRNLTGALKANLSDATRSVGVVEALNNLGSLRRLARAEAIDARLRSPWLAATAAGITTLLATSLSFLLLSLYYIAGVLDSGVAEQVSGGLVPFVGSQVTVVNSGAAGLAFELTPGYLPLILAVAVFIVVAKPWRALRRNDSTANV